MPQQIPFVRRRSLRRDAVISFALLFVCSCGASMAPSNSKAPAAEASAAPPMGAPGMMGEGMEPPPGGMPMAKAPEPVADKPSAAPVAKAEAAGAWGADQEEAPPAPPQPLWAPVREFPVPNYDPNDEGPRTDFRETVFWNPGVRTDAQGIAKVSFVLNDAITSFRATVEGAGASGLAHGEALLASKIPVSLAAKLPLEVSNGDVIELPITLTNSTWRAYDATLSNAFGAAFTVEGNGVAKKVHLEPKEAKTFFTTAKVIGNGSVATDGGIALAVESAKIKDALSRTIRVVPAGFVQKQAASGTLTGALKQEVELPKMLEGSLDVSIAFYPTATANLVAGTQAIIQEPYGCFEQASSANYPNVMVVGYLKEHDAADSQLMANTMGILDRGYKKLVGYETTQQGYDWFGQAPAHEALSAYGLMEFADMAKVYPDLDKQMVARTRAWLKSRRDGKGGYQRSSKSADSFGQASEPVTNAYITYALTEAGESDLEKELAYVTTLASTTKDPYVMALATGALVNAKAPAAGKALEKLMKMQAKEGNFPGAEHSITRSGGIALELETTSLAALAFMKAGEENAPATNAANLAITWIVKQRGGAGGFSSTQATVLSLKALTRHAERSKLPPEGTLTVVINGGNPKVLTIDPKSQQPLSLAKLGMELHEGKNTIEIKPSAEKIRLPYSIKLEYRTVRPVSSKKAPVSIAVDMPTKSKLGEAVKVRTTVVNKTQGALPMVLARVGIPGGLVFQTWQLDELKTKKVIDFYETREREVILYFRGMAPGAQKQVELQLLAAVPGSYTAPASQTYLYYTDEHRMYAEPSTITVSK